MLARPVLLQKVLCSQPMSRHKSCARVKCVSGSRPLPDNEMWEQHYRNRKTFCETRARTHAQWQWCL